MRYKSVGKYTYAAEEAGWILHYLPPVDVLVCHSTPYGISDHDDPAHTDFRALREYASGAQTVELPV